MALPQDKETEAGRPEIEHNEFNPSDPINSYVDIWKKLMANPRQFYSLMPPSGGYSNPAIFLLINSAIGGFLGGLVTMGTILGIIVTPIAIMIGSFIQAAILHLFAILIAKSRINYEATWRVVAYSSAILLISWVPLIGALIAFYSIYIQAMGIEQVHETSVSNAFAIVLVPVVISLLIIIVTMLTIGLSVTTQ